MGKSPAYVFVIRHGNRLDVADKKWVLGSATPYDPPLTYGGWLQARSLGARIANILRQAEIAGTEGDGGKKRRRRFKIVVHSSPFLRCVQTSIGISAGICEPPGSPPAYPRSSRSNSVASAQLMSSPSPTTRSMGASPQAGPKTDIPHLFGRVVLRLDAFLGEWLSPEYFEMITPPPASATMVTMAKADLLRRENYTAYGDPSLQTKSAVGRQVPAVDKESGEGLDLSNMASALTDALATLPTGYMAPTPHYAISNNTKIPDGYVAHARDACVSVDSQWDSANTPLGWGDGGTYGEEWTAMHRRFRKGVQSLVDWYSACENPADSVTKMFGQAQGANGNGNGVNGHAEDEDEDEDEDEESVVILVSHGAGCNALIGAITHQPALMDVGMASLTMAVRKPGGFDETKPLEDGRTCPLIHQCYDMKMTANSDHLRSSTSTPASSRSASGVNVAARGRVNTLGSQAPVIGAFTYSSSDSLRSNSASASLGQKRRGSNSRVLPGLVTGIAAGNGVNSASAGHARKTSLGLWSPIRQDTGQEDEEDDYFPDFDNRRFAPQEKHPSISEASEVVKSEQPEQSNQSEPAVTPMSPPVLSRRPSRQLSETSDDMMAAHLGFNPVGSGGGLWTSSRTDPKRRWTIDEAV